MQRPSFGALLIFEATLQQLTDPHVYLVRFTGQDGHNGTVICVTHEITPGSGHYAARFHQILSEFPALQRWHNPLTFKEELRSFLTAPAIIDGPRSDEGRFIERMIAEAYDSVKDVRIESLLLSGAFDQQ